MPAGVTRPPAIRSDQSAPPRDPLVAPGVGEPQQQIAMTGERRAEANEVAAAQLVERPQKVMLVAQPAIVFRNDGGAVTIRADAERISPFAAAADIDRSSRHAGFMLVENPAHRSSSPDPPVAADWRPGAARFRGSRIASRAMRERLAR
jgi:hypothetical protein